MWDLILACATGKANKFLTWPGTDTPLPSSTLILFEQGCRVEGGLNCTVARNNVNTVWDVSTNGNATFTLQNCTSSNENRTDAGADMVWY